MPSNARQLIGKLLLPSPEQVKQHTQPGQNQKKFGSYTFFECWAKISRVLMFKSSLANLIKSIKCATYRSLVGEAGLEPTTPGLEGQCSIRGPVAKAKTCRH